MELAKETQKMIARLVKNWEKIKPKYILSKEEYGCGRKTIIGDLWWDNPNLIFVLVTDQEEGYEGSQAQIGIAKDGSIRWEYQSHCSCNDYEDSDSPGSILDLPLSRKSYELNGVPLDWEYQIRENIKKLLQK